MPAAPVLATDATGGRIAPRRVGVRAGDARSALLEAAWSTPEAIRVERGGFELELRADVAGERAQLALSVRNPGPTARRLGSVAVGLRWTDPAHAHDAGLRALRSGGDSDSAAGNVPLSAAAEPIGDRRQASDRAGWLDSRDVLVVGPPAAGPCALLGAFGDGRSEARVFVTPEPEGVGLEIELVVEAELAPDERRALEPVELALGGDATALLEAFAERWSHSTDARGWRPVGHAWCSGGGEPELRQTLEQLAEQRDALPVEVVQLDRGATTDVGDWLESGPGWPRGLETAAEEVRAAGFVAGLVSAPFCASASSALARQHPEWLLDLDDAANGSGWVDRWRDAAAGSLRVLDVTRPEVLAHLEEVYRQLVAWGFFHLELDGLGAVALAAGADARQGPAERVRRGLAAVRRGAGEEAFLLARGPFASAVGLADGLCVAPDSNDAASLGSALARSWMHRRLALVHPGRVSLDAAAGAQAAAVEGRAATIAATGCLAFAAGDPGAASADARALWPETLALARAADAHGVPGSARVETLLAADSPQRIALRDAEALTFGLVNTGAEPVPVVLPPEAEGAEPRLVGSGAAGELAPHSGGVWRRTLPVSLAVFCDFDGTFSVQDVGATLAIRHAGDLRPAQWARYERGEITPWEYNLQILQGLPVATDTLEAFLRSVDLDPGAAALGDWCEASRVPFRILSDGFDWNLNRLQVIHGVRFAYTANSLRVEHGRWRIRAGAPDIDCGCGTGTCKGGILRAYRARHPGSHLVHIGNGRVSDTCGAVEADTAFAKDSLADHLKARGERFVRFTTLHDVIPHLMARLAAASAAR